MARHNQPHAGSNEAAAGAAEEAGRAGADILRMTASAAEKSAEQFSQMFGMGGDSEQAAQRYSRGIGLLQDWVSAAANGYQDITREYLTWAQGQFQATTGALARLAQCRTPQDLVATQNQLLGENIALVLNANRRVAEIAKEVADRAAEKITRLADDAEQARKQAA